MTCAACLDARHLRCEDPTGCGCTVCGARRSTANTARGKRGSTPTEAKASAESGTSDRTPKRAGVKRQKRSYPMNVVLQATILREQGASWAEVGETLDVPSEGIRYAVNSYGLQGVQLPPSLTRKPLDLAPVLSVIAELEGAVAKAQTAIRVLTEFVETASDS